MTSTPEEIKRKTWAIIKANLLVLLLEDVAPLMRDPKLKGHPLIEECRENMAELARLLS